MSIKLTNKNNINIKLCMVAFSPLKEIFSSIPLVVDRFELKIIFRLAKVKLLSIAKFFEFVNSVMFSKIIGVKFPPAPVFLLYLCQ